MRQYVSMAYNLIDLGPDEFERLTQALIRASLGHTVSIFGNGADGGREATWNGTIESIDGPDPWIGYGVAQAKARESDATVGSNLTWLKSQLSAEMAKWVASGTDRTPIPDYFLVVTNVKLSPKPGSGIDAANKHLQKLIEKHKIGIKRFKIWHYNDVCAMLDDHESIRRRYRAFITTGDILSQVLDNLHSRRDELRTALEAHAARMIVDENRLNLTQAGSASETELSVPDVFTDLPVGGISSRSVSSARRPSAIRNASGAAELMVARGDLPADEGPDHESPRRRRVVIVGGPGHGKSTLAQYTAQLYRAEFLRGSVIPAQVPKVAQAIRKLDESRERLRLSAPAAKRWPVKVVMTKLADMLSGGEATSILDYIAAQVSSGGSVKVGSEDMRAWLRAYPWIVLIDGLDEVPLSSNREEVLACIARFFIDVASLEGDVVAVATTRPQGYNNDFDPNEYTHVTLADLGIETARAFAKSFIELRNGAGSDRSGTVLRKFSQASSEEATSRLLTSPLQVTIFVILIERQGKAPNDRWRLFDSYYNVIFQREQEKDGPLAEILSRFHQDIDYLHRRVGYELQTISAAAGETSSHLELAQFSKLITRRLQKNGYSGKAARRISRDILVAATERMVFLAVLANGQVGFEIRSLQEFMAAEYVTTRREKLVPRELARMSTQEHWRNVLLFAMGGIFAGKDRLKPEAILLCDEIDARDAGRSISPPGAELALDVLLDGACASQPRFERLLMARALHLLDGAPTGRTPDLGAAFMASDAARPVAIKAIQVFDSDNSSAVLNRLEFLDSLLRRGFDGGVKLVERVLARASDRQVAEATTALLGQDESPALEALSERIRDLALPRLVEAIAAAPPGSREHRDSESWLLQLHFALTSTRLPWNHMSETVTDHDELKAFYVGLEPQASIAFNGLLESGAISRWPELVDLGRFVVAPSAASLEAVLRQMAAGDITTWANMGNFPFPLASVIAQGRVSTILGAVDWTSYCTGMADAARRGDLGDASAWQRTEGSMRLPIKIDCLECGPMVRLDENSLGAPIWPTSGSALPVFGIALSVSSPTSKEEFDSLVAAAQAFLTKCIAASPDVSSVSFYQNAAFILSVLARSIVLRGSDAAVLSAMQFRSRRAEAAAPDADQGGDRVDLGGARLVLSRLVELAGSNLRFRPALDRYASALCLWMPEQLIGALGREHLARVAVGYNSFDSFPDHSRAIVEMWLEERSDPGLLSLAFQLDVGTVLSELSGIDDSSGVPSEILAAARICAAAAQDISDGALDTYLECVLEVKGSQWESYNVEHERALVFFRRLMSTGWDDAVEAAICRAVLLIHRGRPILAQALAELVGINDADSWD